jgi:hypothetical protein
MPSLIALALVLAGPAPDGPPPRLPGAWAEPPGWMGDSAPFDVRAFLARTPEEEAAEGRLFEALFEFAPEMAVAFPEGPERERRKEVAKDRVRRIYEIMRRRDDPDAEGGPPSDEEVDALLGGLRPAFASLDRAQAGPQPAVRCEYGPSGPIPHAQAARMPLRALMLRCDRATESGRLDEAIDDVARSLRLARDLRARGGSMIQWVATAIEALPLHHRVPRILGRPDLTPALCRRVLGVLDAHRRDSPDAWGEAIRAEYLASRSLVHDLVRKRDSILRGAAEYPGLGDALASLLEEDGDGRVDAQLRRLARRIREVGPDGEAELVRSLDAYAARVLALGGSNYTELARRHEAIARETFGDDPIGDLVTPAMTTSLISGARRDVDLGAAECLAVLRLWGFEHDAPPPDLEAAFRAAGRAVPADPFGEGPLKMAAIDGRLVVYSVGRDGRDDGGRVDSDFDRKPGDLTYELPNPGGRR